MSAIYKGKVPPGSDGLNDNRIRVVVLGEG